VLACAEGRTNTEVAQQLRISRPPVGKWRSRFVTSRLEGLADEPRPGAPRTITDAQVEEVITRTPENRPTAGTHWRTRGMAKAAGRSPGAIVRIWHALGLKPHRRETFKLSNDPFFVEKVQAIVGLYLNPPDSGK
jgi:transposase